MGGLGRLAAFSFFPSKTLGGFGDGGAVTTSDDTLARRLASLRNHGRQNGQYQQLGYNSRIDELQAALLRVKLPHLDAWNARRRDVAARYRRDLQELNWLVFPDEASHEQAVFSPLTVRAADKNRDQVRNHLSQRNIETRVYYPQPLPDLPPLRRYVTSETPEAKAAAQQVFTLPSGPFLSEQDRQRVVAALHEC